MESMLGVALAWGVMIAFMAIGQMALKAILGKRQDDDHLPPSAH